MKHLRWICAGALVAVVGTIALANVAGPSRPTAAVPAARESAPVVATVPAAAPAAAPVVAQAIAPATQPVAAKKPAAEGVVPGSMGMMIAIDPETGTVGMPTPEQLSEMQLSDPSVSKDDGYTVTRQGNMSILHTNGAFQEYAVIRKTADGKTVTGCVVDPKFADQLQPAPAAGLEEE